MFAAGAGHHPRMLLTAYAIDKALPSRLQPELLEMYYRLSTTWQDWNTQYYRDNCQTPEREPYKSLDITSHACKRTSSLKSPERTPKRVKTAMDGEKLNDLSDGFMYNLQYKVLICITCGSMVQPETKSLYTPKHHSSDYRAEIVQGIEESRADRVPWLVRTGFATHLRGLRDAEILSSYALPRSLDLGGRDDGDDDDDDSYDFGDEDDVNTDLSRILAAADGTLMDAYTSCSETSPDGKMTRQRALRLSNFRGGEDNMSSAKASKFREFKNGKSLKSYFRIAKQLLVYYYRVVFRDDGHFTRESNDQVLPGDVVEATSWQKKAMQGIINALRRQDKTSRVRSGGGGDEERDVELKHAIRTFYISLICHTVGSRRFRSAVLSFCAMLSRRKNPTRQRDNEQRMLCTWHKPGNFNSNLSSLIWVAQVILFDFVCFKKQDDEDGIPDLIDEICGRYFQQMAETPFGHILQWRLYLFAASSTNLTEHQARWSLDKETIDYRGVELHMDHVSQLVVSEFHQAHTLLYEELLFGMGDIAPIGAWRLHDDLDQDDFGASWLSDERNREGVRSAGSEP
ncbi:hypothetical protein H9L39_19602 [Fusarium oxysporum f. sp. albedinis]|nr:hypothetical protein H9L39_19602 [Fusarium oxysporum f. sp. albedinis]